MEVKNSEEIKITCDGIEYEIPCKKPSDLNKI